MVGEGRIVILYRHVMRPVKHKAKRARLNVPAGQQEVVPNLPLAGIRNSPLSSNLVEIRNSPLSSNLAPTTQAQVWHAWYRVRMEATVQGIVPREGSFTLINNRATARIRNTSVHYTFPVGHTNDTADNIHELRPGYMPLYFSPE